MKNAAIILAIVFLASSAGRAGVIDISLDSPALSGPAGSVLHFTGTLTNTTGALVYLFGDSYTLTLPDASVFDDSPFYANTPDGFLLANAATDDIGLFNITILGSFAPGNYGGTFTLLGGNNPDDQGVLGSVDFTVQVEPTTGVPEPATLPLLGAGAAVVLGRRRLKKLLASRAFSNSPRARSLRVAIEAANRQSRDRRDRRDREGAVTNSSSPACPALR